MTPFVLAAPIYLFIVDRRAAVRYLIALTGIGLFVSIVFFFAFSPRDAWFTRRWLHNMWFHMVTIPRHHPWQEMVAQPGASKTMSVWRAFAEMLEDSTEMIVVLLAVLLILLVGGAFRVANRKAWITENPWVMFILAGVLLVPSAIVGFVKVGGYVNNFALFSFMITIAATTALCANFARIELPALREFARALACGMIIMRAMQVGVARQLRDHVGSHPQRRHQPAGTGLRLRDGASGHRVLPLEQSLNAPGGEAVVSL